MAMNKLKKLSRVIYKLVRATLNVFMKKLFIRKTKKSSL